MVLSRRGGTIHIREAGDERELENNRRSGRQRAALTAAILLLLLLLCALGAVFWQLAEPLTPASEVDTTAQGWVFRRSIITWGGSVEEGLWRPQGIAFENDGSIWVGDYNGGLRLLHFASNALQPDMIIAMPEGARGVYDIAVDDARMLYVADALNGIIWVLTSSGDLVDTIESPGVQSLLISGDTLYAGEMGSLAAYTLEGSLLNRWGEFGRGNDQYDRITGLSIDGDIMYIADGMLNRVHALNLRTGETLWVAGTPPESLNDAGVFSIAVDVQLTMRGLYVLEGLGSRVTVLDPDTGEVQVMLSGRGSEDGQLLQPARLALSGDGRTLAVSDMYNDRVQFLLLDEETTLDRLTDPKSGIGALVGVMSSWRTCALPLVLVLLAGAVAGLVWQLGGGRSTTEDTPVGVDMNENLN